MLKDYEESNRWWRARGEDAKQRNIDRYRRMLANPRDEAQRRMILKLLGEEEAALKG
jgi:hypothetical protein